MKEMLEKKITETREEFEKITQMKNELMNELTKVEQEILRIDGKYIAYQNLLQETETKDVKEEEV